MLSLVTYDSDEDDEGNQKVPESSRAVEHTSDNQTRGVKTHQSSKPINDLNDASRVDLAPITNGSSQSEVATLQIAQSPSPTKSESVVEAVGPIVGPTRPPETMDVEPDDDDNEMEAPLSPYSSNRALLRSYTIPTLPTDFSIPDSPPGSPDAASVKTFSHFLKLKDQNTHFNAKLANNTNLRNPNLLDTLLNFVDLDKDVVQYASTRPKESWNLDPEVLGQAIPRRKGETFAQALARLQKEAFEKQQKERTTVDFVGSSTDTSAKQEPVGAHTKSAAERIMAGLDRDSRKNTPEPTRSDSSRTGRGRQDKDRDRDRRGDRIFHDDSNGYKRARSRSTSRTRESGKYRERDYNRR